MQILRRASWLLQISLAGALTLASAQTNEIVLHNFGYAPYGTYPSVQILDAIGNLYGVASYGGVNGAGLIFRMDSQGHETVLFSFTGGADGGKPSSILVDGTGNLYGTTRSGGASNQGVIYELDKSGHETVLYNFTGSADGGNPTGLIRDAAGNLYGVTPNELFGGIKVTGIVFQLDPSGNFTILHTFTGSSDGADAGNLLLDEAGNLYGTAQSGGTLGLGVLFEVDTTGTFSVVYNYGASYEGSPLNLRRDAGGNFYGTTTGLYAVSGVVYKLDTSGKFTVLHQFGGGQHGDGQSGGGLVWDGAGNLYLDSYNLGAFGFGNIYKIDRTGKETVLYSFTGGADGGLPLGPLLLDAAGNLFGATVLTSATQTGTVFRLDPTGALTVLSGFTPPADGNSPITVIGDGKGNLFGVSWVANVSQKLIYKWNAAKGVSILYQFTGGADGDGPVGRIIPDAAGNLYGVTSKNSDSGNTSAVFKLDPGGHLTILYSFTGGADGGSPMGGLLGDAAGHLYGTTSLGGTHNSGVVFRMDLAGNETILYNFSGGRDSNPVGELISDTAGNLYGIAGAEIFKLDRSGNETVLYSFTGGIGPQGLVRDPAGNLYGTTFTGGLSNAGMIFKLDPSGHQSVLYNFTGHADGGNPVGQLTLDPEGNLYGATQLDANSYNGLIFKVDPAGNETVLHHFTGVADGGDPNGGLLRDAAGNLYGTARSGGKYYGGVLFMLAK